MKFKNIWNKYKIKRTLLKKTPSTFAKILTYFSNYYDDDENTKYEHILKTTLILHKTQSKNLFQASEYKVPLVEQSTKRAKISDFVR